MNDRLQEGRSSENEGRTGRAKAVESENSSTVRAGPCGNKNSVDLKGRRRSTPNEFDSEKRRSNGQGKAGRRIAEVGGEAGGSGSFPFFMDKTIFLINLAATVYLTGVIWVVQLVQYPFFSFVDAEKFPAYHSSYTFRITPVVAPAMILELVTSILLLFRAPENFNAKLVWLGLILTLVVWASTFLLQVPLHDKLARGFDAGAHSALVNTNWIRTAAWSLRAALVLYFVWKASLH
jgi:hypothetical protein